MHGPSGAWLPAKGEASPAPSRALESEVDYLDVNASSGLTRLSRTLSNKAADKRTFLGQSLFEIKGFFLDTKLNLLMLALPFALAAYVAEWGDAAVFILSCAALVPLAERLGWITEQLANYTNDTLGGLLNASFGNATEVIISGFALAKGGVTYLRVVQLSLLGSIISNLLLVLGSAFIAGGIRNKAQTFSQQGVSVNCGLLILATITILLPSLLSETHTDTREKTSELVLSRFESILLLLVYGLYLFFQLKTHRHLFEEDGGEDKDNDKDSDAAVGGASPASDYSHRSSGLIPVRTHDEIDGASIDGDVEGGGVGNGLGTSRHAAATMELDLRRSLSGRKKLPAGLDAETQPLVAGASPSATAVGRTTSGRSARSGGGGGVGADNDDDDEEQVLSKPGCFVWLALVTLVIAFLSEWITDAITGASKNLHIPMPFLTTIILPIVGNAAEHASAIIFAFRNRMEIALGVALGSSTQVAVLVVPFTVILAWIMGQPLDLNFNAFEAAVLFMSVLIVFFVVMDGSSNYLKGFLLVLTFLFISAGFWCHKDVDLTDNTDAR